MGDIIPYLFFFTFLAVLVVAFFQVGRTRQAQKTNEPAVHGVPQPDGSKQGEERAVQL